MDFKQCKVLADIKYCEATNVEYEQYYKDNYDNDFELTEKEDMKEQLTAMYKYSNILASRLDRVGVDVTTL